MNDSNLIIKKEKRAVTPWILGISSILLAFFGFFIVLISWSFFSQEINKRNLLSNFLFLLIILYYVGLILMAIWGLARGVKMLKLEKKTRAILGIILSLLGLVSAIIIGWLVVGNLMATI